ncbi:MAG TPA: hypothetical protein VJA82_11770 [Sediminibacterium sp.]|uniref:hypothetical protein n=1 Tax=Sediminibacterium sp. TaxID=1917865 RepID=UPI0008B16AC5|nr:hypothetical protein [Sediminibacterium sp.]OHC84359.1 MAG: hypothetical protein A2472_12965 [Sphingobacteriia bacterium RIFOXYC2_FULL_35_18]OHC88693.1 MAG: hypothetical protein A2546_02215 [Sphingobacteriia bacterium RIFOXYD2_FULL_35_12]HLD53975.1 hypothetical protein [Sediminibacterium sp.]
MVKDSSTNQLIPKAFYTIGINAFSINVAYPLLSYQAGEKVTVIFETEHPSKASVYRFWGYWIHWEELIGSIIAVIFLFQIAVSITNNPTESAMKEQLDYTPEKKTKYD